MCSFVHLGEIFHHRLEKSARGVYENYLPKKYSLLKKVVQKQDTCGDAAERG